MTANVARFLPYGRQSINQDDIDAVIAVLKGDWLTQGPAIEAFERGIAEATGAKYAVACSNGTAALHLSALALNLEPTDAVIVPSVTFLATANAVRYAGAEVVFADVNPDTGLVEDSHVADAVERAKKAGLVPRAVFPVHLAGQPAQIGEAAKQFDLVVVEDACHALGTTVVRGNQPAVPVGSCPDGGMAVLSFHPVKTIATGEGGAITTNDPSLASKLQQLRSHGMIRDAGSFQNLAEAFDAKGQVNPWYYEMPGLGFNYRLTDIQSALGVSQLRRLPEFVGRRQELVSRYDRGIAPLEPHIRPTKRVPCAEATGWHLYVALMDFASLGMERAEVMAWLRERGIGTQVHYIPVHWQPYYVQRYGRQDLPGATSYYQRCLSLPLFPALQDEDVDYVVAQLAELVELRASA